MAGSVAYLDRLEQERVKNLNALAALPDDRDSAFKAARVKGAMQGLKQAADIFREINKIDDEERG